MRPEPGRRGLVALSLTTAVVVPSYVLGFYKPAFNTIHTPLSGVHHRRTAVAPAPARVRRLVAVLVDGLSFVEAEAVPELVALTERGAFRPLVAQFPSFTSTAITSFVTGLSPRDSGMRLNGDPTGLVGADTTTSVARDAGVALSIRSRGWEPFGGLVRARADTEVSRGRIGLAVATARARHADTSKNGRTLELVYVGEPDEAAHEHGTRSAEFARAREVAGAVVERIATTLDRDRDALLVWSDHGHRSVGGHGGVEPEVLDAFALAVGAGIRRGARLDARPVRDLAPTVSVLLGLTPPSTSSGAPMLDLLGLDDSARARALAAPFDERVALLCAARPDPRCAAAPGLVARLAAGDDHAAGEAERLAAALDESRDHALDDDERLGRRLRGGVAALGATLVSALGARRGPRGALVIGAAIAGLFVTAFAAVLAVRGYSATFSAVPPMKTFLRDAGVAALVAAAMALMAARRVRRDTATRTALAFLAVVTLPYAVVAAYVGCDPRHLPPPLAGVLVFFGAPAVVGAAVVGALTPWATRRTGAAGPQPPR